MRDQSGWWQWTTAALFLAGIFVAGLSAIRFAPLDSPVALWWPAAGLSVALLLKSPRRSWAVIVPLVMLANALANLVAGRDLLVSLSYGAANGAEALIVVVWLTRGLAGAPALVTQEDRARLFDATILGASTLGLWVALTALASGEGQFVSTMLTVMASHGASILVIVPLAMPTELVLRSNQRAEVLLQAASLVAVIIFVFRPGQVLGIAFLILPALVWGALRFSMRVVSWELLVVSVLTTRMAANGWGPFAPGAGSSVGTYATTGPLVQAFLISCAVISMTLCIAVGEQQGAMRRMSASEELFRKSFTESLIGMMLLRIDEIGRLRIVELNGTAAALLDGIPHDFEGHDLASLLDTHTDVDTQARMMIEGSLAGYREELGLVADPSKRVGIAISPLSAERHTRMFTAQMLDMTPQREARRRLNNEKNFTRAILDTTGCLIVVAGLDGLVDQTNPATERATGFTRADLAGRPLWESLIPEDDRERTRQLFADGEGSTIPMTLEATIRTRTGDRRRIVWSNSFLNDEHGSRSHVVMTGIDVTTERTTVEMMTHLLRAATTTAFIGTDLRGRVNVFNSGAEEMLGFEAAEVMERPIVDFLFDSRQLASRAEDEGSGSPGFTTLVGPVDSVDGPLTRDWHWQRADGTRVLVSQTVNTVRDTFGRKIGYLFVGRNVTEQRRSQELLVAALDKERQAVERLRALDAAKNDFVSTVSHELRTPITSIVGYTEMIQDGAAGIVAPEMGRLLDAVRRNGDRLMALADDLLTLAGFESGSAVVERTIVDLREIVSRTHEALAAQLHGRRLELTFELPADSVLVRGDAAHLERVVSNLLGNAIKFTDDGGSIRCAVKQNGRDAMIEVSDTGIGIPVEEQSRLFSRFFRSSTAQERAIQGTGLGLSIAASIVRTHGGDISVNSAHLAGTSFEVRLPLNRSA